MPTERLAEDRSTAAALKDRLLAFVAERLPFAVPVVAAAAAIAIKREPTGSDGIEALRGSFARQLRKSV